MDAQIGYTFQPGSRLNGLGILLQVSNLLNSPYRTYVRRATGRRRWRRSRNMADRGCSAPATTSRTAGCLHRVPRPARLGRGDLCALAAALLASCRDGAGATWPRAAVPVAAPSERDRSPCPLDRRRNDARAEGRADHPGRHPLGHAGRRAALLSRLDPQWRRRLAGR